MKPLFIHIPRTGGISVRNALGAPQVGNVHEHATFAQWWAAVGSLRGYEPFTIVRNPYARFWSALSHLYNATPSSPFWYFDAVQRIEVSKWFTSGFPAVEVVERMTHFAPQVRWLDVDGWQSMVTVIHTENLQAEISRVPGMGSKKIPRLNASKPLHVTLKMRRFGDALCRVLYREDFEAFGYDPSAQS